MQRLAILLLIGLAGCASEQKFDLVCSGSVKEPVRVGSLTMSRDHGPQTMRFSVDLKRNVWCHTEGCNEAVLQPIKSVTPATLELRDGASIDRTSGQMTYDWGPTYVVGQCTKTAYSALPRTRF